MDRFFLAFALLRMVMKSLQKSTGIDLFRIQDVYSWITVD